MFDTHCERRAHVAIVPLRLPWAVRLACLWLAVGVASGSCSGLRREAGAGVVADPITLRWSTASEFENYGYHVYRSRSSDGPFDRLTDEAVEGAGTTDLEQHYSYSDETAEVDVCYFYFVESISVHGTRKRITPVTPFIRSSSVSEGGERAVCV